MFKNTKIYNQDLIIKSEKKTFEKKDSFSIMQIAAKACSNYIFSNFKPKRVLILCGPGNNGGDGILIAKDLLEQKCHVKIFAPLGCGKSKNSRKALTKLNNNALFKKNIDYRDFDVFIDALFGFNFERKLTQNLKKIFTDINLQKFFNFINLFLFPSVTIEESRDIRAGALSPIGEAFDIFPPMVATFLICNEPYLKYIFAIEG